MVPYVKLFRILLFKKFLIITYNIINYLKRISIDQFIEQLILIQIKKLTAFKTNYLVNEKVLLAKIKLLFLSHFHMQKIFISRLVLI